MASSNPGSAALQAAQRMMHRNSVARQQDNKITILDNGSTQAVNTSESQVASGIPSVGDTAEKVKPSDHKKKVSGFGPPLPFEEFGGSQD